MTTRSDGPEEKYWRGASGGDEGGAGDASEYAGPPPTEPPPPGWRPPIVVQPPPPRRLPPQDEPELDRAEESARTLTLGIGMLAGAVLLIVICVLCSRVVF